MTIFNQLEDYYKAIDSQGCQAIIQDKEHLDNKLIYPSTDQRTGLSLVVGMDDNILNSIKFLFDELRLMEPYQYYYPYSDIHTTILTVLQMKDYNYIDRNMINLYDKIFKEIISQVSVFNIFYKGISITDTGIILNGYYEYQMVEIRESLRSSLIKMGFHLAERYKPVAAHSTLIRFRDKLRHRSDLIKKIHSMKDTYFGYTCVKKIDFVYHDWYNTSFKKIELESYTLRDKT